MAKGLIWATAEDLARNRGPVLSLYRQILRSLNSPDLLFNFAARLAKKAEARAIFVVAADERSVHNIKDLIGTGEYYVAPSGETLSSLLEIQRYLDKHPEYMSEENDADDPGMQHYLPLSEVAGLTWVSTDAVTDLQLSSSPTLANNHLEAPVSKSESQPAKRMRIPSPPRYDDDLVFNVESQLVNVEEPHHL